jgi:hypothetical protein
MPKPLLIALVVIATFIVAALLRRRRVASLPYRRASELFTAAERTFLSVLDQAVGPRRRVFGKVRVADLIEVRGAGSQAAWQRAFNRISSKHFDFVVCASDTLVPLCVIELDDSSHDRHDRRNRDALLTNVCRAAQVPLVRVRWSRSYSAAVIQKHIDAALSNGNSEDSWV